VIVSDSAVSRGFCKVVCQWWVSSGRAFDPSLPRSSATLINPTDSMLIPIILAALAIQTPALTPPLDTAAAIRAVDTTATSDTVRRRPRAVEYSDAYATRLTIHRLGSYTMLPLFAAEYALGQNLLNDSRPSSWIKPTHTGVALGLGALFTVNTVTGLWNLWDARSDPADRPRRYLHTALMLASDAGFAWTGAIADGHSVAAERHHRAVALGSMSLSIVGTGIMWFFRN
jgi:hypothetical protein